MGRKVFLAVDVIVILLLCLICMVPLLNLLAYSFSASQPIIENKVFLWPKEFTWLLFLPWEVLCCKVPNYSLLLFL